MSQIPVSPSPFDKIIRAAGAVRTRGGFAALSSILFFLSFIFAIFFVEGAYKLIIAILILVIWGTFTFFAFITMRDGGKGEKEAKPKPIKELHKSK
ncbi:MAG: hypothetical protein FJ004_08560 [Chloroflexi bacterium]|nr:hypothetical protein [Chloroflexota bacterium]